MFKKLKPVEIHFYANAHYVLQPIEFTWRNIEATRKMIDDPDIMRYFCAIPRADGPGWRTNPLNLLIAARTIKDLAREPYNFMVVRQSDNSVAACVALRPRITASGNKAEPFDVSTLHLSVAAFKEYRGHGLMLQAWKTAAELAFRNAKVQKIEAAVLPENKNSIQLLKKAGFKFEETVSAPKEWYRETQRTDVQLWKLIKPEAYKIQTP